MFKYYLIKICKAIANFIYLFMKLLPTRNKVCMISRFNSKTSIDFRLLKENINLNYPKTKVVILNHKLRNKFKLLFDILYEMIHIATSKAVIIDSYVIPVSILTHKRKLIIVQIWHAMGAIKKFGHACLDMEEGASSKIASIMNMHQNYTYITAPGAKTIANYYQCFNSMKTKIIPVGMPRMDYLSNRNLTNVKKQEILDKYPGLKERKNILYFPTFRKKTKIPYESVINAVDLDKYNLIVMKHQNDKTKIPDIPNIYILNDYPVMDMLLVADYFISDYSASFFEASMLNIPFHAYVFDYEKYEITRGIFMDLKNEIPGKVSRNIKDIIKAIDEDYVDKNKYKTFKKNYAAITDGSCTQKIVSLLELKGGF